MEERVKNQLTQLQAGLSGMTTPDKIRAIRLMVQMYTLEDAEDMRFAAIQAVVEEILHDYE